MTLTVSKKLYGVLGLLMVVLVSISVTSFFVLRNVEHGYEGLIKGAGKQLEDGMDAQIELGRSVQAFKNLIVRKDEKYVKEFEANIEKMKEDIKDFESKATTGEEKELAKKAVAALDVYVPYIHKVQEDIKAKKSTEEMDKEFKGLDKPVQEALLKMDDAVMKEYEAGQKQVAASADRLAMVMIGVSVVAAVICGFFGVMIIRGILKAVKGVSDVVAGVSKGDLTNMVPVASKDEIGEMAMGFNNMIENLRRISQDIKGMTTTLASSSEELSATTTQLNEGTKDQAKQTEQAATAITEVSQTVMDVAQNAASASTSSKEASQIAAEGKQKVQSTVSGMDQIAVTVKEAADTITELGKSSQQIGNIVSTINDIADQTNLLALNAAIEAARAGEQGRGFAVVADEVRKLAERTGKATKEIGDMIKKIQAETEHSVMSMKSGLTEVEKGVSLAQESKQAMEKIVEASNRGADMIQRIAVASEEQSSAAEQISSNMESISRVTKSTEASAGQISVAAHDLSKVATDLSTLVQWFKMEGEEIRSRASSKAAEKKFFFETEEKKGNGSKKPAEVHA